MFSDVPFLLDFFPTQVEKTFEALHIVKCVRNALKKTQRISENLKKKSTQIVLVPSQRCQDFRRLLQNP